MHGRIDVPHNNVGYAGMGGPVELPKAEWDRMLDLDLKGVFLTCKHALPIMLQQGKGAIVNISSIAAIRWTGYPDAACPMGRMGMGWDVAHAAVFLASDEASYIIGACLPVDGGISLRGG